MNIMPIVQDTVWAEAGLPLDYRAFTGSHHRLDTAAQREFLSNLHMKTGGSRLARLFVNNQWCFGNQIVDLAELEDIEPNLTGLDRASSPLNNSF